MTEHSGDTGQPQLPWPAELSSTPGWTVHRSRDLLTGVARTTWTVVRALAASTLDVPQLEFKLATGRHLHVLVEFAAELERRLDELAVRQAPRQPANADLHRLVHTLQLAPATARIAVLHGYWLPRLGDEVRQAAKAADPLLDGPTVRILLRGAAELDTVLAWSQQARAVVGSSEELHRLINELHQAETRPEPASPPTRPCVAARDERYTLFDRTRDYRRAPDWHPGEDDYADALIELLRINRDEIDAIETFSLTIFDLVDELPLEALRHLARLSWDEARHAAIGHLVLEERGVDGFSPACSMIGINMRAAMHGHDAWAQITLFGELGIIGPMRELVRRAHTRGDKRTAAVFDFVCSDEVMHLRESRRWLDRTHPAGALKAVAEVVRQQTAELLAKQGVLPKEHYLALSREQIFALVGE